MKEIFVKTQAELNALPDKFSEHTLIIVDFDCAIGRHWDSSHVEARDSSRVVARDSAHVVARGSSHVEARDSAHVEAWDSSHVEAWDSSHVVAWGSAHVEAWDSSHVEAWGSSHVVAWGSAHVVARDSVSVNCKSENAIILLFGFSVCLTTFIKNKIKTYGNSIVQYVKNLGFFENNGIEKKEDIILYKRVSKDFKTQERKKNETLWTLGTIVSYPNWKPKDAECGEGKFHACSRPYFCDEFRNEAEDKYIAIEIESKDLHEWKNPAYPHKIAFRKGKVLFECDRYGEKV